MIDDHDIQPRTTEGPTPSSKRRHSDMIDVETDDDGYTDMVNDFKKTQISFQPLYLISQWQDVTTRKCLSVVVNLPSGVNNNFTLTVMDAGKVLQLMVNWPSQMTNLRTLHHLWLVLEGGAKVSDQPPKLGSFETALRSLRTSRNEHVNPQFLFVFRSALKQMSTTNVCAGKMALTFYTLT